MDIFTYKSYKIYLDDIFSSRRGEKGRLAKFVGCQSSFVSQVLKGDVNFSLEHGVKISQYLALDEEENEFFMLLILKERAGSYDLQQYFKKKLKSILKKRSQIKERIKVDTALDEKDLLRYYSQWFYSAIHILTAIPGFDTEEMIAEKLNLPRPLVKKALGFLLEKNLVSRKQKKLVIGNARIHIDSKSPLFIKHHTNWRLESIKALENTRDENLHYSGVLALGSEDYLRIREILLNAIEKSEKILKDSPEEKLVSLSMDLFEMNP